jgi:hypothetical protein
MRQYEGSRFGADSQSGDINRPASKAGAACHAGMGPCVCVHPLPISSSNAETTKCIHRPWDRVDAGIGIGHKTPCFGYACAALAGSFAGSNFASWSEAYPGLSAAASSGHALPLDDKDPEARSPITEKFYSVTQRMPLKTLAMKAWSEAVLSAYLKAGGVWPPRPYEAPVKKSYRTKNWRKLGIDFVRISIPNGAPPRIKPRTLI